MKVLVTGGTGFAGHALTMKLRELGHEVSALDTRPGIDPSAQKGAGIDVNLGSVTDREIVSRLVAGTEVVYHLAAAFREMNMPMPTTTGSTWTNSDHAGRG